MKNGRFIISVGIAAHGRTYMCCLIITALPFTMADYFALVDSTGRVIRDDKRGFIPSEVPPIIQRFGY